MTIKNHWGVTVNSELPTTGVLSIHDIALEWLDEDTCLTCNEILENIDNDASLNEDQKQNEREYIECDSSHTRLLGDWIQDEAGQYLPDKEKGEFSAIENEGIVQVVWSKFLVRGPLCSPCYPGQCDIDADSTLESGQFLAYTLPDYLLRKTENE